MLTLILAVGFIYDKSVLIWFVPPQLPFVAVITHHCDTPTRRPPDELADRLGDTQLLARRHQVSQVGQRFAEPVGGLCQRLQCDKREEHALHALRLKNPHQFREVLARGLVDKYERLAAHEGREDFLEGGVEPECGILQRALGAARVARVVELPLYEIAQRPVMHRDALRAARRA